MTITDDLLIEAAREADGISTVDGTPRFVDRSKVHVLIAARLREVLGPAPARSHEELIEMRKQSVAVCEHRTRERDEARDELERLRPDARLGAAVRELTEQLRRMRRQPCPTQGFGFEPADIIRAAWSELAEVEAEQVGSPAAQREVAGVLATGLHLALVHGASLVLELEREVGRLRVRNDVVAAGGTWQEAKAAEVAAREASS